MPLPRDRRGRILPPPTYDQDTAADAVEKPDRAKLKAALTRFETKYGADALIAFLKLELERRGEQRWRLDQLAPKPGANGQSSLLDSGR